MLATLFFEVLLFSIVLSGVIFYRDAHIGIDKLTEKIKTDWLRTTIRILLKVGAAVFIAAGVVCTIICVIAFSYEPKNGKKKN